MTDMDPGQIAASVVSQQISQVCDFAVSRFGKLVGSAQVQFRLGLKNYLDRLEQRLSRVKTLLYRDAPTPIENLYVEMRLQGGKRTMGSADLPERIVRERFIVVTGTAGSGKSMLMRKLFLSALSNRSKVPIFLELRTLNSVTFGDPVSIIYESFGAQAPFDLDQIRQGLKQGIFSFYFDGFDEVNPDRRDAVEALILRLSEDYPTNTIVVSSRQDETFSSWSSFHVYHVLPLSLEQVVLLISKLEYDSVVKERFMTEIRATLYGRHPEFLSNPLLATMMLLTYDQFADIPSKVHVFYQQAFETLFQKHDALKAVYRRKNYSGLAIDEFKRAFASFCALTYFAQKITFTEVEAREFAKRAVDVSGLSFGVEDFLRDMLESVCVLQRDGLNVVFVHRSFQEYFTAYFVVSLNGDRAGRFIQEIISGDRISDNVIAMSFDMNTDLFEAQWALSAVRNLCDVLKVDQPRVDHVVPILFHDCSLTVVPEEEFKFEIDVFYRGGEVVAACRALMDLYKFEYLTRIDRNELRRKDELVLDAIVKGTMIVESPTEEFASLIDGLRSHADWKAAVTSKSEYDEPVGEDEDQDEDYEYLFAGIFDITNDLRASANMIWLDQSSTRDFVVTFADWLQSLAVAMEQREQKRSSLFDGLFKA